MAAEIGGLSAPASRRWRGCSAAGSVALARVLRSDVFRSGWPEESETRLPPRHYTRHK